jgi:hypothetical protein
MADGNRRKTMILALFLWVMVAVIFTAALHTHGTYAPSLCR